MLSFTNNDSIPFMLPQIELRSSLKAKNDAQSKPFMDYQMVRLECSWMCMRKLNVMVQSQFSILGIVHFSTSSLLPVVSC